MKLIDKTAVVAGIEGKINKYTKRGEESDAKRDGYGMYWGGVLSCLNEVRSFLDTLEVKEVDEVKIGETQIYLEDDGGEQPYDGKQWLDLSCTEYEIPKALFKDGDNVEILIRKAQKGDMI